MNPIRIAYLINQYPKVSHSFIRREIQGLEKLGIGVERFALRGWDATLADAEDERERLRTRYLLRGGLVGLAKAALAALLSHPLRWLSALVLTLRMARRSERPWPLHLVYLAEACLLASWAEQARCDHLHAHFGTNSTDVVMLAALLSGCGYSFTVHGPEEFDKPAAINLAEKVRRSSFVVAISSYGRGQLYRWVDAGQWDKIRIVHCGLEQAFHDVAPVPVPVTPRLVCVGRLCEQKGQLLLLRAAHLLARKGVPLELVLAGDGELRPEIERAIAALGLGGQVSITGWIGSAEVRERLLASRALVLPSFAEGLPVVIMEAMALRRPVLSTYIAGIPELVTAGENGWLFASGSVEELAAAMEACLRSPPEALAVMGERARQRALERHDSDREAAKLAEQFRRAIHSQLSGLQEQAWSSSLN
ncbi:Glycosyltransferase involved in cell wall bisynthesis [Noviherbaspirillum humi]|uniref:Glycosyltransferase involved in cell wall bisynthesis n=1 Tax=Noviherbaspirillum humi TaxID=1688639 RepID=A0A239GWN6_9BURK|nr:glycosyltransferase [Noviherbaspirillum humi]SNS73302.1 Glycosyltransferase involved in cell wall bisynthesis [Noviherbaspirillum humi]